METLISVAVVLLAPVVAYVVHRGAWWLYRRYEYRIWIRRAGQQLDAEKREVQSRLYGNLPAESLAEVVRAHRVELDAFVRKQVQENWRRS